MSRAPHIFARPALGGLFRAGGAAARCMSGLDAVEARLEAIDTGIEAALDGHVLTAPPAWEP